MRRFLAILLACATCLPLFAELPPSAYEKMQKESPEVLRINVLRVDSQPETPETTQVTLLAQVVKVGRSSAGVKPGDLITIKYDVTERPKGWAGPGEVPVPEIDTETVAFLRPLEIPGDFAPAAGAMSFSTF
jgi:hypothetical protein